MRQRNIKNLDQKLAANASFLIEDPRAWRGRWREAFAGATAPDGLPCAEVETAATGTTGEPAAPDGPAPLFLEIGCGKGQFITRQAALHPEALYLAVEGQDAVALRALEKAEAQKLPNLRIFIDFVKDMGDYFQPGELTGIYLNFSDPWPKARHAARRLTYRKRLMQYMEALEPGGFVEFKTDNEGLYRFTLEEIQAAGLTIAVESSDLHASDLPARLVTTEYEDKFRAEGKPVRYLSIVR